MQPFAPALSIARIGTTALDLSWAANAMSCSLEFNSDLKSTSWQIVTNAERVTNGFHHIVVEINDAKFFRLRSP